MERQSAIVNKELLEALSRIRLIPDYPYPGILFRDITPLLGDPRAFETVVNSFADTEDKPTYVAGLEARGFILGAAVARAMNAGFIPLRKQGKLPYQTHQRSYGLEYGSDAVEVHIDAASSSDSILLIDDVLATGGTAVAGLQLISDLGARCTEVAFLLEIASLGGREKITSAFPGIEIRSLMVVE